MRKFLLIDDHFVVRAGTKGLLKKLYDPCEVHETADPLAARKLLKEHSYDLIIMDIHIPGSNILGFMEHTHAMYPQAKVLMFTMSSEAIYAKRFLKAGAMGFLTKDSSFDELEKAINLILKNRKYISETLALILADDAGSKNPLNPFHKLSARELQIVSLLLSGQTLTAIGGSLNLQASTIGTHKARAFEKLGVKNILQLRELANNYNL